VGQTPAISVQALAARQTLYHVQGTGRRLGERLGFVWNSHDQMWEERLKDLKGYKAINGDCNVSSQYILSPPLVIWVKVRRMLLCVSKLQLGVTLTLATESCFFEATMPSVQVFDGRENLDNGTNSNPQTE